MIESLITSLFLLFIGIISAQLYNKNILHYFYFAILMLYVYPYFPQFLQILPRSTSLVYFPIIIFPFLFNTKLLKGLYFTVILLLYSILIFLINLTNPLLFLTGIIRYIYFFMILILFYKTNLNQFQVSKIFRFFLIIFLIQLPVNLINMFIFNNFHSDMGFADAGGGTLGAFTSGTLGMCIVLCLYMLIISSTKINFKVIILYLILLLTLSLTYSGGSVIILTVSLIFFLFRPSFRLKISVFSLILLLLGFCLFNYTHQLLLGKFVTRYEEMPRYSLVQYTINRSLNIKSIILPETNLDVNSQGRAGAIRNAMEFAENESSIMIGAGVGSLNRSGALENLFNFAEVSSFNKVFRYNAGYTNGYAIVIGEIGILGLVIILYYLIKLLRRGLKYSRSNKTSQYFVFIYLLIFLMYSYYENAIYLPQFLFLWAFGAFNIKNILKFQLQKTHRKISNLKLID